MARYKHIDTNPKFLPVDLARQLRPGTFEYALNYLLDREIESPRLPWRPVIESGPVCATARLRYWPLIACNSISMSRLRTKCG